MESFATPDDADQRYYASSYGRFNTADPYQASANGANDPNTPLSWNKYAYVLGDPVNYTDPQGLYHVAEDCIEDPEVCESEDGGGGIWYDQPPNGGNGVYNGPGGSGGGSTQPPPPDCNSIVASVGFTGLTYSNALAIWNDANLSAYQTDSAAATVAALAAVTWQGENSFQTNSTNHLNSNGTVDIGPFQLNYQTWKSSAAGNVFGTNVAAGQAFNGSVFANIGFAVGYLETLLTNFGDNAAGAYIDGHVPKKGFKGHAAAREQTWQTNKTALEGLFDNTYCFSHK